jgi:hypothetical protein
LSIRTIDVRRLARKRIGGDMRHRVNLLGVGGVGTNILAQAVKGVGPERVMFRIYDDDTIELHNLNRTKLFRLEDMGKPKVLAVRETVGALNGQALAPASRPDPMIAEAFNVRTDSETKYRIGTIIDARDTLDPTKMHPKTWIKLAYDGGTNLSFTWRPHLVVGMILDLNAGSNSYEVVPSFYVPAALLASLTFNFMRFLNFLEITDERAGTVHLDFDQMIEEISFVHEPLQEAAPAGEGEGEGGELEPAETPIEEAA